MVSIVVSGAAGRMGKRIVALAQNDHDLKVVAGVDVKPERSELNMVGELDQIRGDYACVIEFTSPAVTVEHAKIAAEQKKSMVIGTTGLSDEQFNAIKQASEIIPIVFSPNMSVCVNLFFDIIKKSAGVLGKNYKISINETHHIHKKDSPSGTAKFMARIAKEKSGNADAPIHAMRKDEIVGDHDIIFESEVDTLKISHSAKTRDIFALGALTAAKFIVKKKMGLFSMSEVLGLEERKEDGA